jgi:alkanesulfonate monooxygenase SsuD/methylene tetrahydromethanopterin reductase-like flavin-dependent oxidoreductase (luciferase family)
LRTPSIRTGPLAPGKQEIWPTFYWAAVQLPAYGHRSKALAIEFGIFDHVESRGGASAVDIYENRIALLKRAEEGGFYAFHLAEHHGHALSISPSATTFLAALARETTRLKLIPTVVCLPLHNPVRIFEELAMLDVLSHGRLELGVGRGITPFEHLQFGSPPAEASARSKDIMALLLRAWETGTISSEGSDFYEFLEMRLPFKPVQHPYPPLWTAGNVEAAGRGGHNLLVSVPVTPEVRAHYDELRAASRAEPGHQNPHVTAPRIGQCQGVVIAETDEKAEAIARRSWNCYSESLMRAHGTVPPHLQTAIPEMDNPVAEIQLRRDPFETERVVAGTLDRVRDYYVEQVRRGLANYFVLMLPFGDMTAEETATTLEGFITEVTPAVRKAETEVAS